jgi:hypothetical protein
MVRNRLIIERMAKGGMQKGEENGLYFPKESSLPVKQTNTQNPARLC